MSARSVAAGLLGALALGGIVVGALSISPASADPTTSPTPTASASTVSSAAAADLKFSRDEERMARDLYTHFAEKYPDAPVFANIARSEARHYDSIGLLLQRYGIDDPAQDAKVGTYAGDLQKLYDGWLAQGDTSVKDAYAVGVALEKRDIADLESMLKEPGLPSDVKTVYGNLLRGSQNHLRAFEAAQDGKTLGARNGQGMQNGRGGNGQRAGTGQPTGQGGQFGRGRGGAKGTPGAQTGTRQGGGFGRTGERPATCPLNS